MTPKTKSSHRPLDEARPDAFPRPSIRAARSLAWLVIGTSVLLASGGCFHRYHGERGREVIIERRR